MMTMMITVEMRTLSSNSDFDYLEYVGSDDTDKNCDDKEDNTDLKTKILLLSKRATMRLLQCIKRKLRIKEAPEEGGCAKKISLVMNYLKGLKAMSNLLNDRFSNPRSTK